MLTTIEGTYENGRVELRETPSHIDRARVIVTFLPDAVAPEAASAADRWQAFRQWVASAAPSDDVPDRAFDRGDLYP